MILLRMSYMKFASFWISSRLFILCSLVFYVDCRWIFVIRPLLLSFLFLKSEFFPCSFCFATGIINYKQSISVCWFTQEISLKQVDFGLSWQMLMLKSFAAIIWCCMCNSFYFFRFDAVIHFAGLKAVGESVQKPLMYYNNNLIGTITLLEVMAAHGCKKVFLLTELQSTFVLPSLRLGVILRACLAFELYFEPYHFL